MKIKRKVKKNKLLFKLLIILLVAFILGILYIAILNKESKNLIQDQLSLFFSSINKLNYQKALINSITNNLFYTISIWILGITIIGIPIIIILLIMKSFILGFTISSIIFFYHFKGVFIALIYIIPQIINLVLLLFISYYAIIFSKNLNRLLFLKKEVNFRNIMRRYIKILVFVLICIILSSVVETYVIPLILRLFNI